MIKSQVFGEKAKWDDGKDRISFVFFFELKQNLKKKNQHQSQSLFDKKFEGRKILMLAHNIFEYIEIFRSLELKT